MGMRGGFRELGEGATVRIVEFKRPPVEAIVRMRAVDAERIVGIDEGADERYCTVTMQNGTFFEAYHFYDEAVAIWRGEGEEIITLRRIPGAVEIPTGSPFLPCGTEPPR